MQTKKEPTFTVSKSATRQHAVSHIVGIYTYAADRIILHLKDPAVNAKPDKLGRSTRLIMRTEDVLSQLPGLLWALDHFMELPYRFTNTAIQCAVSWWVTNADEIMSIAQDERSRGAELAMQQSAVWARCAPEEDIPYTIPLASEHDTEYDVRAILQLGKPQLFHTYDIKSKLVRAVTVVHQWPNAPNKGATNIYVFDKAFDRKFPGLTYVQSLLIGQGMDSDEAAKEAVAWWTCNAQGIANIMHAGTAVGLEGSALYRHMWEALSPAGSDGNIDLPVFSSDTNFEEPF